MATKALREDRYKARIAQASKRLYTLKEGATYLGRSEWGMRELIWAGVIPVVKPQAGRKIFLDVQDLDQFVEKNKAVYR